MLELANKFRLNNLKALFFPHDASHPMVGVTPPHPSPLHCLDPRRVLERCTTEGLVNSTRKTLCPLPTKTVEKALGKQVLSETLSAEGTNACGIDSLNMGRALD